MVVRVMVCVVVCVVAVASTMMSPAVVDAASTRERDLWHHDGVEYQ
jgi:hypothetical protein